MYLAGTGGAWFALQVKYRHEKAVALMLGAKGYEYMLPVYNPSVCGSRARSDAPLFSGYVFCRLNEGAHAPIITTPGVIRIVGCGKRPECISASEIDALRVIAKSGIRAEPHTCLSDGQWVRVTAGPLSGLVGRVLASTGIGPLVVSITLLNRAVAVPVERSWLVPIEMSAAAVPA